MERGAWHAERGTDDKGKSEVRTPKSERNLKSENRPRGIDGLRLFRSSDFGLRAFLMLFLLTLATAAFSAQRFPPPDFVETHHQLPETTVPVPRAVWVQYLDVAVLAGALGVATWMVHRSRSRRGTSDSPAISVICGARCPKAACGSSQPAWASSMSSRCTGASTGLPA